MTIRTHERRYFECNDRSACVIGIRSSTQTSACMPHNEIQTSNFQVRNHSKKKKKKKKKKNNKKQQQTAKHEMRKPKRKLK
ncbi:hypothetical protein EAE99_006908 [Botrytis elliptica]|nr:hypothetical protein EAE99_006908 [Botrytis elliptica]